MEKQENDYADYCTSCVYVMTIMYKNHVECLCFVNNIVSNDLNRILIFFYFFSVYFQTCTGTKIKTLEVHSVFKR